MAAPLVCCHCWWAKKFLDSISRVSAIIISSDHFTIALDICALPVLLESSIIRDLSVGTSTDQISTKVDATRTSIFVRICKKLRLARPSTSISREL